MQPGVYFLFCKEDDGSDSFYRAYQEVNPIPSGYEERRDLYNLYHMLNHLNLFGTTYLGEVNRIVGRYQVTACAYS